MLKQRWRGRGRPASSGYSYKDIRILEYLARIVVKYKVGASEFVDCIVDALNLGESECKQLNIICRKRTNDSATFLFTNGRKVVAQFPIPITCLQGIGQLEMYTKTILAKASLANRLKVVNAKIGDLRTGMKEVSLKAKVLEISKSKRVFTRYGTTVCVSNALISDETGSMKMPLWNHQIDMVSKGDMINIKNGKVAWFRGERQLSLGKRGSFSVIE